MFGSSRSGSPWSGRHEGFAVLSVFAVMAILISALAAETFRQSYRRQEETYSFLSCVATVRAAASCVERDLSEVVRTGAMASMFRAGWLGENSELVRNELVSCLNRRILAGWSFSGFREVSVDPADENSVSVAWRPDGSMEIEALFRSRIVHISGAEVSCLKIREEAFPRYLRLARLAALAESMLEAGADEGVLENTMNESYACELIAFRISGGQVTVWDLHGGCVILG